MPSFTMELWRVREFTDNRIGLDAYPIFDEAYRSRLNSKIIDHYYNEEIALETIDLFVFGMRKKMNEIMPYYNQLYLSERLEIDPLNTIDMKTVVDSLSNSSAEQQANTSSDSVTDSKSRAVNSTLPQQRLRPDADYATSAADSVSNSEAANSANEHGTSEQSDESNTTQRMTGFSGSQSDMLNSYRDTFLNVDLMVISELSDLFMGVWDNGNSFTPAYTNFYKGMI